MMKLDDEMTDEEFAAAVEEFHDFAIFALIFFLRAWYWKIRAQDAAAEICRLRAALLHIECEPINAEYMARQALSPNAELGVVHKRR